MEPSMADPETDFDDLHQEILSHLREGRVTPSYLAELTDESRQLISSRLRDLTMAGYVEKIHTGLYELVEDPQESENDA